MTGSRRRRARPLAIGAALAIPAWLCGCQPLPHPFADDRPPAALLAVPDSIDIAVGSFEGEPRATAAKLPLAVAHELVKHNIPATDQTPSRASYRLDGRLETHPDQPGKSLVTVFWRLRDPNGTIVSERSDRLVAPAKEWDAGDDHRVAQLAAAGAGSLAALLADETPKEQAAGGRVRVAIRKVSGAPGDGNTSLATSLTAVLKHQDIDLVDAANGRPDLAVDCDVKLDPGPNGQQHVKIVWRVAHAAGAEVGQVAQENDVPRGRLDAAWGDLAFTVAMAAEGGIMQLVDRGTPPAKVGAQVTATVPRATVPAGTNSPLPSPSSDAPPVAGNIDSPEVNLPPVEVKPQRDQMPTPLPAPDVPVLLPPRGVPIPH